jgi:hypothetical protein
MLENAEQTSAAGAGITASADLVAPTTHLPEWNGVCRAWRKTLCSGSGENARAARGTAGTDDETMTARRDLLSAILDNVAARLPRNDR